MASTTRLPVVRGAAAASAWVFPGGAAGSAAFQHGSGISALSIFVGLLVGLTVVPAAAFVLARHHRIAGTIVTGIGALATGACALIASRS